MTTQLTIITPSDLQTAQGYRTDAPTILTTPCCNAESYLEYDPTTGWQWTCWNCGAAPQPVEHLPTVKQVKEAIWEMTQDTDYIARCKFETDFERVSSNVNPTLAYWRLYESIRHDYEWCKMPEDGKEKIKQSIK